MSQQEDLQKLIADHERRLQKRREQKAKLGISADPSIDIEIEDIETTIAKLQAERAELETSQASTPQPEITTPQPAPSPAEPDPHLASFRVQPRVFLCHAREENSPSVICTIACVQMALIPGLMKKNYYPARIGGGRSPGPSVGRMWSLFAYQRTQSKVMAI